MVEVPKIGCYCNGAEFLHISQPNSSANFDETIFLYPVEFSSFKVFRNTKLASVFLEQNFRNQNLAVMMVRLKFFDFFFKQREKIVFNKLFFLCPLKMIEGFMTIRVKRRFQEHLNLNPRNIEIGCHNIDVRLNKFLTLLWMFS